MPDFAVILPAGGGSTRFGGPRSKLLEPLAGLPVIGHGLRAFLGRSDVAAVVIPARAGSAGEVPGETLTVAFAVSNPTAVGVQNVEPTLALSGTAAASSQRRQGRARQMYRARRPSSDGFCASFPRSGNRNS